MATSKDSSDFMLTEYERISTAYFGLQAQINDFFKSYLTLIGFPLTILAAVLKLGPGGNSISLTDLPNFVSLLLLLVSVLGVFVTFTIVAMRMEMILYARTINGVRRFFGEMDQNLPPYLILPTSDGKPDFYEPWRAIFWQVLLIGILDSAIATFGLQSLIKWQWTLGALFFLLFMALHLIVYRLIAFRRAREWKKPRFEKSLFDSQT